MVTYALDLQDVTKRFGSTVVAVDHLSLSIKQGGFLGLLGRNGAGKTTTIHMCTGLLRPSSGRIVIGGLNVQERPLAVKQMVGVMPQEEGFFDCLTGQQYLYFVARMYGLEDAHIEKRSAELFETFELAPEPGMLIREYSYGMKKKLGLSAALIHAPRVLFLDEPFEGIDPLTSRTIKEILIGLHQKGITILMSSHILEVVEKLCPLIAIIDCGQLKGFGTMDELRRDHHGETTSSLEDLFIQLMGGAKRGELSWL